MRDWEQRIEQLAALQHGRFTRKQVAEVVSEGPTIVRRRLRSERWRRVTSRVLALPGAPDGDLARLWTAHLHVGADSVASHLSAAMLHGFPSVPPDPPTLTLPNGCNRRYPAGRLHQSDSLREVDITCVEGIPVTTVGRALVDLAAVFRRPRVEGWVDHALGERLVSIGELREVQLHCCGRRKQGAAALGAILDDRLAGPAVEESLLERVLTSTLRLAGVPDGVAQHPLPGRPGDRSGLVDRAWPEIRWIVEVDGRRHHGSEGAARVDRARDRSASTVGWQTTRLTYSDLVHAGATAASDLRAIYCARLALFAA